MSSKELKKEIHKAVKENLPENTSSEEILSCSSLLLKKILSQPYFKGNYDYIKVYGKEDGHYVIGHGEVNNFKNVTNETLGSRQFYFDMENESSLRANKIRNKVLPENDKVLLSNSIDVIENARSIDELKEYFEENEKEFYNMMNYAREFFFFNIDKNLIDTLRNAVSVGNEDLKNNYKIETYGDNNTDSVFKMDTFALRDNFFYELNNLIKEDNDDLLEIITDSSKLTGGDFRNLLFGDKKEFMHTQGLTSWTGELPSEEEKKVREQLIQRVQKNRILSESSLLNTLLENSMENRHRAIYDKHLFDNQRAEFVKKIGYLQSLPSFEEVHEKHKDILNPAFQRILEIFPELKESPDSIPEFKVMQVDKEEEEEQYKLLEALSEHNAMNLYDDASIDLGAKDMKYISMGMFAITGNAESTIAFRHNDFEVAAIGHFIKLTPEKYEHYKSSIGRELLTYNETATHFKENKYLEECKNEAFFEYAKKQEIVVEVSKNKYDMPKDFLSKALEREDCFIATDGPACEGLELYYLGLNEIKEALFESDFHESKIKKGDESPVTYQELLSAKKEYTSMYKKKFANYEEDYSELRLKGFSEKNEFSKFNLRSEIKEAAMQSLENSISLKTSPKSTKKQRMS